VQQLQIKQTIPNEELRLWQGREQWKCSHKLQADCIHNRLYLVLHQSSRKVTASEK